MTSSDAETDYKPIIIIIIINEKNSSKPSVEADNA